MFRLRKKHVPIPTVIPAFKKSKQILRLQVLTRTCLTDLIKNIKQQRHEVVSPFFFRCLISLYIPKFQSCLRLNRCLTTSIMCQNLTLFSSKYCRYSFYRARQLHFSHFSESCLISRIRYSVVVVKRAHGMSYNLYYVSVVPFSFRRSTM